MIVFLLGFMGAGKSYLGRQLAKETGSEYVDLDEELVKQSGENDVAEKKPEQVRSGENERDGQQARSVRLPYVDRETDGWPD